MNLEEFVKESIKTPLSYEPGTQWRYSYSTDICGYLVEVLSGLTLDKFLKTRIFDPLKMNDTFFELPKEKINRFTTLYNKEKNGELNVFDSPSESPFTDNVTLFSGAGGLLSTTSDFYKASTATPEMLWKINSKDIKNFENLHSFLWLAKLDRKNSKIVTKNIIKSWINNFFAYDPNTWEITTLSNRIIAWSSNTDITLEDSDREYKEKWEPPSDLDIIVAKDKVGFNEIKLSQNSLIKAFKGQQIDVNAIAKGWGVDHLFSLVESFGYTNFMVEIGGEVRVSGKNIQNKPWQIGIDYPLTNTVPGEKIIGVVSLVDRSMATSGNYRNFYEFDKKKYSHILDPRTGYPIDSNIASVTVVAPLCMDADAIATALSVMSLESGKVMVEENEGIEAFWVLSENEKFRTVKSAGMSINLLD